MYICNARSQARVFLKIHLNVGAMMISLFFDNSYFITRMHFLTHEMNEVIGPFLVTTTWRKCSVFSSICVIVFPVQ